MVPLWELNHYTTIHVTQNIQSTININSLFTIYRQSQLQTLDVEPLLVWYWANVSDGGLAMDQPLVNASYLIGEQVAR